ncbi:hypothetical protein [Pedobacter kyonggii]|uniref:Uncharacterized protein n=1 Tax=Pedobacter kyonggii TaxID=1926871 RepID=A0A4Q9H7G6_9SPHI|nr:hypothetical protein [Pedobacter kyonggii]TBO39760.1 hypothetical protein EYS08_22115 [Pedobacter kyonggii]
MTKANLKVCEDTDLGEENLLLGLRRAQTDNTIQNNKNQVHLFRAFRVSVAKTNYQSRKYKKQKGLWDTDLGLDL